MINWASSSVSCLFCFTKLFLKFFFKPWTFMIDYLDDKLLSRMCFCFVRNLLGYKRSVFKSSKRNNITSTISQYSVCLVAAYSPTKSKWNIPPSIIRWSDNCKLEANCTITSTEYKLSSFRNAEKSLASVNINIPEQRIFFG